MTVVAGQNDETTSLACCSQQGASGVALCIPKDFNLIRTGKLGIDRIMDDANNSLTASAKAIRTRSLNSGPAGSAFGTEAAASPAETSRSR
jgi:hypothetical protein